MARQRRIAITGATGQLGQALLASNSPAAEFIAISRPSVDITEWTSVRNAVVSAHPDVVIHAAAATDVDGCERYPETAYLVNALGTRNVARAAAVAGADLVYVSTNYVFDGTKDSPYHEWDIPLSINVYGASKLAGEAEALNATNRCFVARTAMLYSLNGNNFVLTMRRLMEQRDELRVVADQYGNPTCAADLASSILAMLDSAPFGIYHLANEGVVSWHEWATEIRAITGATCDIVPIPGSEFERAAQPPVNGGMRSLSAASLGIALPDWRDALRRCLAQ